jgi:hypothetical protein
MKFTIPRQKSCEVRGKYYLFRCHRNTTPTPVLIYSGLPTHQIQVHQSVKTAFLLRGALVLDNLRVGRIENASWGMCQQCNIVAWGNFSLRLYFWGAKKESYLSFVARKELSGQHSISNSPWF